MAIIEEVKNIKKIKNGIDKMKMLSWQKMVLVWLLVRRNVVQQEQRVNVGKGEGKMKLVRVKTVRKGESASSGKTNDE